MAEGKTLHDISPVRTLLAAGICSVSMRATGKSNTYFKNARRDSPALPFQMEGKRTPQPVQSLLPKKLLVKTIKDRG